MANLIANTGIHFKVTEVEFNPNDAYILPCGRPLKYTFVETVDYLNDCRITFDVCSQKDGSYVAVNYLRNNDLLAENSNGTTTLDESGVPKMKESVVPSVIESYLPGAPELININSLNSYMLRDPADPQTMKTAFQLLLGTWLPMPMFEVEAGGVSTTSPTGWCRVKIDPVGDVKKDGKQRFRLTWAFDTRLAEDLIGGFLRPYFFEGEGEQKKYALCNRVDNLFSFLSIGEENGDSAISDYLVSKLGIDITKLETQRYKFVGYYIYLCNLLRVLPNAAPVIDLYNKLDKEIPVDLSIDIGNSRTSAILFEEGDFRRARELYLRDLSEPWHIYDKPFDMRIVFRKADFGGDLIQGDGKLFQWPSIVRVGEEASNLMHKSLEDTGLAMRATNYSSPKRYLWDKKEYKDRWEFLVSEDDPTNLQVSPQIFIEGFTDYFDHDGTFLGEPKEMSLEDLGKDSECKYSRSSLMTFVMIELLQQAIVDINSSSWRDTWLNINCRRYLRNVIITCPTAMPNKEQISLRQSAIDAFTMLQKLNPTLHDIQVTPSPDMLRVTDDMEWEKRGWTYDEAFASQLVYLYGEVAERYKGENDKIIEMKGHVRPEHKESGYEQRSLTIGSIDIGAGTTDVMIAAYQYHGAGQSRLTPDPLFWDSFYLAGDDVMKQLIISQVIEGPIQPDPNMGGIYSALEYRMLHMTDEELKKLSILERTETQVYQEDLKDILRSQNKAQRDGNIRKMATDMVHGYFGVDSSLKTFKDRICRNDFNTQVSVRLVQFFLQQLSEKLPRRVFTFNDIFGNKRPSDYLLSHFEHHFGFRLEELSWVYDPKSVGYYVRTTLEPLMKLLSVVLEAYDCDIIVLSGRPCSLDDVSELFIKYYPVSPDRLVRLKEDYHVGEWYPAATPQGYFRSPKSVVSVGAMVGFMASHGECPDMELDFSKVVKNMKPTARYIGFYNSHNQQVDQVLLSPQHNSVTIKDRPFPIYLGCKQFSAANYSARPLYAIYNHSRSLSLSIMLQRNYMQNREELEITSIMDREGNDIPLQDVELIQQSIADDGLYWLDKGEFELRRMKGIGFDEANDEDHIK